MAVHAQPQTSVRFGIITLQNTAWTRLVEKWQYIESLGFDSLWVADHFVNPNDYDDDWFEAWTLLAALATNTSRIRIGTLVSAVPLRNAVLFARQAVTLDHVSSGRLELGMGSGLASDEDPSYSMTGINPSSPSSRVNRFHEAIDIVDQLLRHEVTTFYGRYFTAVEAQINPRSLQLPRPPITCAAIGPKMLRLAARYADTWNTYTRGLEGSLALAAVRDRNDRLTNYCLELGREPSTLRRSLLVYGRTPESMPFASVDAFCQFIGQYQEVGIEEFIFYYPPHQFYQGSETQQARVLEQVATDIIPRLRKGRGER
jgi:alkanesulfonate monooxygenase SsuD/methylene tetrahydromethanopterin reductase-like flavin-dependent oxidoreductase (luciferase family)